MTTWIKTNGNEIELNDEEATIEKAEELGWKRKAKRKRRTKAEMEAARNAGNSGNSDQIEPSGDSGTGVRTADTTD